MLTANDLENCFAFDMIVELEVVSILDTSFRCCN